MKTIVFSFLLLSTATFSVQAQTVVSLPDIKSPDQVQPITDQPVYDDTMIDAHIIWAAPGFKKARTGAPVHEQIFVLEGKINFIMEGKTRELAIGHWVILPANTPHTIEVLGDETVKLLAVQSRASS